ncbi:MAG TPA: transcription elongation factor Spt5 [archaeon]|nr:transcription elongation factor Spt5 [archaeon]
MIYTVKTVVGRENIVLDSIASKVKTEGLQITALLHPEEIKGYVFVEGDVKDIEKALQMVPHIRGLIKKQVEIGQIHRFLQPKTVEIELTIGDIVEVIGGPFKGERGKVTRYDKTKREMTMELIEVTVPIPITVSVEFIKLIEKANK